LQFEITISLFGVVDPHACETAGLPKVVPHPFESVQVLVCNPFVLQALHAPHVQLGEQDLGASQLLSVTGFPDVVPHICES